MSRHLRSDLVFRLSCWVLALVAFCQLLTAGVALAVRVEKAQEVKIVVKEGPTKIITVAPEPTIVSVPTPKPVDLPPLPEATTLPPPRPLSIPAIADPVVEQKVGEARKARVADDMATAITKVESALELAPKDPNVLYEKALIYEKMAAADPALANQAADAYQQILELGTTGAGSLYALAGEKLAAGIAMPADLRGQMALGTIQIYPDRDYEKGQRTVITVPVHAAPDIKLEDNDLQVKVTFYDSIMKNGKREIVETATGVPQDKVEYPTGDFDFKSGEELVRFPYILERDNLQQEHLFGKREFYGYVVELIYKGEVLDTVPWPRHLASRSAAANKQQQSPSGNPWDDMPEFLNVDGPGVLPNLPADPHSPVGSGSGDIGPPPP